MRRLTIRVYGRGVLHCIKVTLRQGYRLPYVDRSRTACSMSFGWSEVSYESWLRAFLVYVKPFGWSVRHADGSRARTFGVVWRGWSWGY